MKDDKWTLLCIDAHSYLKDLFNVKNDFFNPNRTRRKRIKNYESDTDGILFKKIKVCAKMYFKNAFITEKFVP